MAKPTPAYPTLLFKILWLVQAISSLIVVIFFYATWANVKDSAALLKDFAEVGDAQKVTEWNAPWFFKLLHLTAHLALITTISTYTANWFGRLYPPVSCFLNFACLMLYIAGVAGVAAFSFMLDLLSRCNTGSACTTFKIAFLSAHLAGATSMAQMVFDGYAWGRRSLLSHGYSDIGNTQSTAYEGYRGEGKLYEETGISDRLGLV